MKCTIEQIAKWAKGQLINHQHQLVTNVVIDTRQVVKGSLFVPFKGQKVDGHQFVEQAFDKGAVVALWEKGTPNMPNNQPLIIVDNTLNSLQAIASAYLSTLSTKIIAITGSNGKTTTKDMISTVLASQYHVQKTQGNYNNEIGVPLTVLSIEPSTDYAIIEMGMDDFGQISDLSHLVKPDIAVITNIGESHLQQLGSREGIAKAKSEIIEALNPQGLFLYNGDEPLLVNLHQQPYEFDTVRYGLSTNNQIIAENINEHNLMTSFEVNQVRYQLPVLGKHNVYNALAAIIIGQYVGLTVKQIATALMQLELTPMRMQVTKGIGDTLLINDAYNASPTSMKAAIDTLSNLKQSCKILIVADMLELGEDEISLHQEIGHYLNNQAIDIVLTYGSLAQTIHHILLNHSQINSQYFEDKQQLIDYIKPYLGSDTVILAKGSRGMRMEEILDALSI